MKKKWLNHFHWLIMFICMKSVQDELHLHAVCNERDLWEWLWWICVQSVEFSEELHQPAEQRAGLCPLRRPALHTAALHCSFTQPAVDLHTRGRAGEHCASLQTCLQPQVSLLFSMSASQLQGCILPLPEASRLESSSALNARMRSTNVYMATS